MTASLRIAADESSNEPPRRRLFPPSSSKTHSATLPARSACPRGPSPFGEREPTISGFVEGEKTAYVASTCVPGHGYVREASPPVAAERSSASVGIRPPSQAQN